MERIKSLLTKLKVSAGLILIASTAVTAQQTLFNVPEVDATEHRKLFFQQQVSFSDKINSETTFSYGLGKGWEAGVNLFNLGINSESDGRIVRFEGQSPQESPKALFNVRKSLSCGIFRMSLGTRMGSAITDVDGNRFAHFTYLNPGVQWGRKDRGIITAGGYVTNSTYSGGGPGKIGFMAGMQVPLWIVNFKADYLGGNNELSHLTVGGGIFLPRSWELAAGVMIPSNGNPNPAAITVQLSNR